MGEKIDPTRWVRRHAVSRGFTRSRVTTVAPHPMRTRRTVLGSLRSSNPRIRASAKAAAIALGVHPSQGVHRAVETFNRDSLEG